MITSTPHGETLEIAIQSSMTHDEVRGLSQEISEVIAVIAARTVTLNLAEVPLIDSAGLGTLVEIWKSCKAHGQGLNLCSPQSTVATALRLTRLTDLIPLVEGFDSDAPR